MREEPAVINLSQESGLIKVVFLIFGLFSLLIAGAYLVISIVADIPVRINEQVYYKGEPQYILYSGLIFVVLLTVALFLLYLTIKSMIYKEFMFIDRSNNLLTIGKQNILTKKERCSLFITVSDIDELILMHIVRSGEPRTVYEYRIYALDKSGQFDRLVTFSNYDKALVYLKFIAKKSGVGYSDITDIDYSSEYDFLKFYKRRES